ncbi:MAG: hypothetical protein EZS28_037861, partial [Streblomastix strix]
ISEYQYKFIPSLASGINNAWILYFNAGVDRYGELWSLPTGYSSIQQLFPNIYGNIQINPTATGYDDGFDSGDTNRGLCISADGNTLSFNGQIIAGTGAPVGSVNYSQGNPILWGVRSLGTDGGFYNDGTTVFWRDQALQFDPYHPG